MVGAAVGAGWGVLSGVMFEFSNSSRRRAVVVVQESAETMPRIDSSTRMFLDGQRENRPIADSLMIAFPMVMLRVLTQ